ncbi:MAG: filamentous hemagglutinin N-terminal domain-containing protein [Cyanobacteria bacterium J06621_8]
MFIESKTVRIFLMLLASLSCATKASAQVIPDGSTSTTVTIEGSSNIIRAGEAAGGNLFHSFADFSVPSGGEAFFDNASSIDNIISRVTGGRISEISGLIRANGTANLFLVNPAGIVFNEGASLSLGGSFYGSTADSVLFPDGVEFSASSAVAPILTVNAPIGLSFRDNPAPITLQGANLNVTAGQNLALLGGDIEINTSNLIARNGEIFLGGLSNAGTFSLDSDLGFNLAAEGLDLAEISLNDLTLLDASGNGSGAIALQGNNISLTNDSVINGGVNPQAAAGATPGNIQLLATESISLAGNSVIRNNVTPESTGDAGNIQLTAANISLDGSRVSSTILGEGNAGGVIATVSGELNLTNDGQINSRVVESGNGNAGDLDITAGSLSLDNSAIFSQTLGTGDAGALNLDIANTFIAVNDSRFQSQVSSGATGNADNITIDAASLVLDNALITADSNGFGNAANVIINITGDISLDNDTLILSKVSQGEGNAGDIIIDSAGLFLDSRSLIISNTGDSLFPNLNNTGNAGDVIINSSIVSLDNFSLITSNALSNAVGAPGDVEVNTETLTIAGGSNINALTENSSDGGTVTIDAQSIDLNTGGKIVTGTDGGGNGGNIVLNITDNIELDGDNPPTPEESFIEEILQDLEPDTGFFANATDTATGAGGSITINGATAINIVNGAQISVASEGAGSGGSLTVQAEELNLDNGGVIEASTNSGTGGNINLQIADTIFLNNTSNLISARAQEDANGGNLTIDTTFVVALPNQNNDILASAVSGDGGNISITAESLFGIEERSSQPANSTNDIDASSEFGVNGEVSFFVPDVDQSRGATELDTRVIEPQATVARACSSTTQISNSSLNIRGKGGIPIQPVEPFFSDSIVVETSDENKAQLPQPQQGILTAQGYIYPARSVAVKANGEITLVSYPSLVTQRNVVKSQNCL